MTKGWKSMKLGDLCKIALGKTPARAQEYYWDPEHKTNNVWLSIADLLHATNKSVTDSREYLSDKGAAVSKIVKKGTLLVSFKLTLGRLAFAGRDLFTNEAIAALEIIDEDLITKEFLYYSLQHFDWHKAAENDVKLKGMTLNKAKLREIVVHFPPLPEQRRIVKKLDEVLAEVTAAKTNTLQKLNTLDVLKSSILHQAFSGKL